MKKNILFAIFCLSIFFSFAITATEAASFTFISWTDTNGHIDTLSSLSPKAKAMNPSFSIFEGDLEDDGADSTEMNDWIGAMNKGDMFHITFPVRGNHDDHVSGSLTLWDSFFDLADTADWVGAVNFNSMAGYNDAVFSFDFSNSHFVGLDVPGSVGSITPEIISWLDADLTLAEARGLVHAFIYFHGPIYCFGGGHCDCTTRTCIENSSRVNSLISIINNHPIVTATFHGHEHMYAYSYIDDTRIASVTNPFYQFVSGNSGGGNRACNANRCDYETSGHGFALVTVEDEKVTVSWYNNGDGPPVNTMSFQKPQTLPVCGDGTCDGTETCLSCPADCGSCPAVPVCGDGTCDGTETCLSCPADCGSCPAVPVCGDGTCDSTETCLSCPADCGSCPADKESDLNKDNKVDVIDFGILLSNWNNNSKPASDINQDGRVDETDLSILLNNWSK
jgi:hypothetical protein